MAVSASGLLTLLFLIFIGPVFYAARFAYNKLIRRGGGGEDPSNVAKEANDREELSSNQYLFALIGYASGMNDAERSFLSYD